MKEHKIPFQGFLDGSETIETLNSRIKTYTFHDDLLEAFDIYFFIQTINDTTKAYNKDIKVLRGIQLLIYKFFEYHSAHIE